MGAGRPARPARSRWIAGGALSGVVGAALFGGVLMLADPDILSTDIPALYGLGPSLATGWGVHLFHGAVLGVVFGLLVTRPTVFAAVTEPAETPLLADLGMGARLTLAGLVYGIVIWTLLPFIGLTLVGALGTFEGPGFGGIAAEMFIGHVVFGTLVGALFSLFVPSTMGGGTGATAEVTGR